MNETTKESPSRSIEKKQKKMVKQATMEMNMLKQKLESQQRNNMSLLGENLTSKKLQGVISTGSPIKIPALKGDNTNFVNY